MAPTPQVQKSPDLVTKEEFEFQANQVNKLMEMNKTLTSQVDFMMRSNDLQKGMKPTFLMPETSKSFDDMLRETGIEKGDWMAEVSENISREKGIPASALQRMQKSLSESVRMRDSRRDIMKDHPELVEELTDKLT